MEKSVKNRRQVVYGKLFLLLMVSFIIVLSVNSCARAIAPVDPAANDGIDSLALFARLLQKDEQNDISALGIDENIILNEELRMEREREEDILRQIREHREKYSNLTPAQIIERADIYQFSSDIAAFNLTYAYEYTVLRPSEKAGWDYIAGTYYIGDSVTMGLSVFKVLDQSQVYASGSIDPYQALKNKLVGELTIPEALAQLDPAPARIVITLGMNSVSWSKEESYIEYYGQLIDVLRAGCPSSDIIIQTITPVTKTYEEGKRGIYNSNINRFNALAAGLAESKGVYFLNTAELLKDEDGYLKEEYSSGDGLHESEAAYRQWIEYLCTHVVP